MFLFAVSVTEWTLIFLFTVILVYKHSHKDVPLAVKLFTFTGWFMGFSIIAILPLDILIVRTKLF